jgi:hypothetical protein
MFIAQTLGSIIGCFVNYAVLDQVIDAKRPFLDGSLIDPTGQVSSQSHLVLLEEGFRFELRRSYFLSVPVGRPKTIHLHERFSDMGLDRA